MHRDAYLTDSARASQVYIILEVAEEIALRSYCLSLHVQLEVGSTRAIKQMNTVTH